MKKQLWKCPNCGAMSPGKFKDCECGTKRKPVKVKEGT